MQKRASRNFIIGISFVLALVLLYFGVNFLKGINILKKQNAYIVLFEDVSGLNVSSPVYVQGFQVGLVNSINIHSLNPMRFAVSINLEGDYRIPKGSYFEFAADLLGSSAVNLVVHDHVEGYIASGDTLFGKQKTGMMSGVENIIPKADTILLHIDSMVVTLNRLMSNPMWQQAVEGIGSTVEQLDQSSRHINSILASLEGELPPVMQNLSSVSNDLKDVTAELNALELDKTFLAIDNTVDNLRTLTTKLNSSDNSLGKLTNDSQLHDSLTHTITTATKLLEDIRQNPERYLSIRLKLF